MYISTLILIFGCCGYIIQPGHTALFSNEFLPWNSTESCSRWAYVSCTNLNNKTLVLK